MTDPSHSRPSLSPRHTRTSEKNRQEGLDVGISITVDGRVYTVRQGDLTSLDSAALRRETGYSFMGLLRAFQTDPDIDLVAGIVWLARRIEGEKLLTFETVATEIGYDADIDVVGAAEPETDPEA